MDERIINLSTTLLSSFLEKWLESESDEVELVENDMFCGKLHPAKVFTKI